MSAAEFATVRIAAATTGVSARTIRYWIREGKLPAVTATGGNLVRLDDVERLAAAGRQSRGSTATADEPATATTTATAPSTATVPIGNSARDQLEAIRDEWLAPLMTRIGELEREAGHLTAEVEHERQRAATAEAAHVISKQRVAQAEQALDALELRLRELEQRNAESSQSVQTKPQDQPQRAQKPRQRRWWLRLFGIDE